MSSGHLGTIEIGRRKFCPAAGRGKTIEAEQGSATDGDMAELDYAAQADELTFIDFIPVDQFGVVAEVPQEPIQLPQGFGIAIEPAGNNVTAKAAGLKNNQGQGVIRFVGIATKLNSV